MPLAAFPKCFLDALAVRRSMSVDDWIELAARELDVDGLEFYWPFTPRDAAGRRRVRALLDRHGLAMPMMCVSPDFTQPDAARRRAEVDEERRAIDATAELGGCWCRVLSGQRRPGISRADGIAMVVECIAELIPYARDRGVVLTIENHYKDGAWAWPEFAQASDVFFAILDAFPDEPSFAVNYDPSNAIVAGEDPLALLERAKGRVVTMHASDRWFAGGSLDDLRRRDADPAAGYAPFLRHGVIGRGLNDYDRIFAALRGVGFDGWVSIEDGDDPVVGVGHLRESAVFLRRKMAEHGFSRRPRAAMGGTR